MDLNDNLLSEDDLSFLDGEVQKEFDKCSSVRPAEISHSLTQCLEPNTQMSISHCFDDEGDPQMEHLECLKSKFHHGAFRAKQWDIIKAIGEKRDVCAVMVR